MKSIRKHIYILCTLGCLLFTISCEDLAFGDKFLQKPPSTDVTIDTIFSTAEYARRVLWASYQLLPYGIETYPGDYRTTMYLGNLEGLTDLNHDYVGYSGLTRIYYAGNYNATTENSPRKPNYTTKFHFETADPWKPIRNAWLFYENVDRVPDMDAVEKSRMKAEAKVLVAVYYAHMMRHLGGLPIVDHAIAPEDTNLPVRSTLQETVDFIIGLLDDAINCPDLPWRIPENEKSNYEGRMCKAAAYALKVRVLLFIASPLYNNDAPYFEGESSAKYLTWLGGYDRNRWKDVIDACESFFNAVRANGYFKLVEKEDTKTGTYRQAFQDAYYTRGSTETLISVRRNIDFWTHSRCQLSQAIRWGGYCPTKELFDMFPMADGTDFDWNNPEHRKNPFINRDPRLSETIILDGDNYQGHAAQVYAAKPDGGDDWPKGSDWQAGNLGSMSLATGLACRKFGLDRGGELNGRYIQWPHLRLAEIYLSYAEALNEYNNGPTSVAYDYLKQVRARVGLTKGLKSGMDQKEFREALLHERACEFAYEEVRFFDLIRWRYDEKLTTPCHGLIPHKNKKTGEYDFTILELQKDKYPRAWWRPGGFSRKWYLSAFPASEINKGYGMIQNAGWE